MKQENNIHSR